MGILYEPPVMITEPTIITNMVHDQIGTINAMVTTAFNQASNALTNLSNKTFDITWTEPTLPAITSGVDGISAEEPTAPALSNIIAANVTFGGSDPVLTPIDIPVTTVPDFVEKDYGFAVPLPPTVTWPTFSGTVPGLSDIQIPTAPGYTLPAVPTIDDIVIPAPPEYAIPDFDGVLPADDITPPVVEFAFSESLYNSQVEAKLSELLYSNLVNGGSGLPEATEQAIYDRATSRMNEEEQALLDNISDGMAARGFPMPPGALVSANLEAENKVLRTRTDLNNDILIQQSKLAQENTHFMIQQSIAWEQLLIGYHNNVQSRILDAAKYTATIAMQMYAYKIEGYKAKLAAYQTLAEVYKARIMGEAAKAEFYKAQMEGVKAHAEVKKALVQAYVAQVESVKVLMEAYRTEMEGANIRAEIDKVKISAFMAEVQAYVAQVNASTSRYEGYKAQITGEVAKAEMAKTDAEAYTAKVQGFKAVADVNIARAEAQLTNTKAQTTVFSAYVEKYKADVQKALADAEIAAKRQGLEIDVYKAGTAKYSAELDALVRNYLGAVEYAKAQAELSTKSADIGVRAALGQYELAIEAAKGVAQVGGSMVAGLGSAVNASLNASSSETRSDSRSEQRIMSSSANDNYQFSIINQHIYQE